MFAQSLHLFLTNPTEDPRPSTSDLATRLGVVSLVTRMQVKRDDYKKEKYLQKSGAYLLLGAKNGLSTVYIGETDNIDIRLGNHLKNTFWNKALVFTTKDDYFNKARVKFLEHMFYHDLKKAGKWNIDNQRVPVKPRLSKAEQEALKELQTDFWRLTNAIMTIHFNRNHFLFSPGDYL